VVDQRRQRGRLYAEHFATNVQRQGGENWVGADFGDGKLDKEVMQLVTEEKQTQKLSNEKK